MRKLIARILTFQAKRFLRKHSPKVVVITGSVGKTSTTQAIAHVLSEKFSVRKTVANYNTDVGVPCSIFNQKLPQSIKNPVSWIALMLRNEAELLKKQDIEILVLELGADVPGEIKQFSWLQPHIAVVTAVAPEHMENFKTLDRVAKEELGVSQFSSKTWINQSMVDKKFLNELVGDTATYDRSQLATYGLKQSDLQVVGKHSIDAVVAALSVGKELGMTEAELVQGAKKITARPGRMNILEGINGSTLIDDTYNSSPVAVFAALDYLYSLNAPQRIALLGNMNELGDTSKDAHIEIGTYCDPAKLDLVVTLGPDANTHTATSAHDRGCVVQTSHTPYEAAEIIQSYMKEGAVVLLKGSQNKVFAEEATKLLLRDAADAKKLVRQSTFWNAIKQKNFGDK